MSGGGFLKLFSESVARPSLGNFEGKQSSHGDFVAESLNEETLAQCSFHALLMSQ